MNSNVRTGNDAMLCIMRILFQLEIDFMHQDEKLVIDLIERNHPPLMTLSFFRYLYFSTLNDISQKARRLKLELNWLFKFFQKLIP